LWRSFPKVPHLLQYVSNGNYYARIKANSKRIREKRGRNRLSRVRVFEGSNSGLAAFGFARHVACFCQFAQSGSEPGNRSTDVENGQSGPGMAGMILS